MPSVTVAIGRGSPHIALLMEVRSVDSIETRPFCIFYYTFSSRITIYRKQCFRRRFVEDGPPILFAPFSTATLRRDEPLDRPKRIILPRSGGEVFLEFDLSHIIHRDLLHS